MNIGTEIRRIIIIPETLPIRREEEKEKPLIPIKREEKEKVLV